MGAAKRERTRFPGVYFRESSSRKHQGRADVCYDITYKVGSRKVFEKVGWKSEGVTAGYAKQVRDDRLRELRQGGVVTKTQKLTLDQAFEMYCSSHLAATDSERRVRSMYSAVVSPAFGHMYLSQISTRKLQEFVTGLHDVARPATIRHYIGIIKTVYNMMRTWGEYLGPSPVEGVVMPSVDNDRTRFLTQQEAAMLLDELCCRSVDTARIALLSLHTGMRAGEIFALRGENVNMNEGIIHIVDPKSGVSRVAYMSERVRRMMEAIQPVPGQWVFPARHGGQRTEVPDTFERAVADLGLNDGIEDARDKVVFHTLRHTFASWLISEGAAIKAVQELMGHSTIKMTERYAKLAPDKRKEAARLLNMLN